MTPNNETTALTTDIEPLATAVLNAFPPMDEREQHLALALLRALAKGKPVPAGELASAANVDAGEVEAVLARWSGVFYNDDEHVIGFNGLAVVEMSHRFAVAAHELWTWCAWDTLFLPELIRQEARVSSTCPVTGAEVTLTVGPAGVRDLNPPGAVVSFLVPDKPFAGDIVQSFCHFVHFFASREAGDTWTNEHEGTFLLSVDDAYELGQRTNRAQFGDALPASPTTAEH